MAFAQEWRPKRVVWFWRHAEQRVEPDWVHETRGYSKSQRLLSKLDFQRVFAENRRSGNENLLVLARANDLGFPRLGLAIAKKHLRRAVDRNRIKRLVRESFRHNKVLLGGLDVVVISRTACLTTNNRLLHASLQKLWHKLIRWKILPWDWSESTADTSVHWSDHIVVIIPVVPVMPGKP